MIFEFTSEGSNGHITKLVKYSETNLKDLYNLAFGDKDDETGEINDKWEPFKKDGVYEAFLVRRK